MPAPDASPQHPPSTSTAAPEEPLRARLGRLSVYFGLHHRWAWTAAVLATLAVGITEPLSPALLKPLLEAQIRKEVSAAALEDRADIEQRGYPRLAA